MAASFVGNTRFGDGQAATTTSLSGTITASSGDYIVLTVESRGDAVNLTTPAGWTLLSGPDRVSTTGTAWLLARVATGSTPVTLTFSQSQRVVAVASVYTGVSGVGVTFAKAIESATVGSTTLPTLGSVPADAVVHVSWARRYGGTPAPDVTAPAVYTQGANARAATAYGSVPDLSVETAYRIAPSTDTYGGETASVSSGSIGVNYVVSVPATAAASGVTIAGVAAQASLSASPGAPQGGSVTIEGVPARASLSASPGTIDGADLVVEEPTLVWPPDPFRQAIRSGLAIWYTVDAWLDGEVIAGDLAPTGGTITDTSRPGVRRTLSVEFADDETSTLFGLLKTPGVQLTVTAHLRFTSRQVMTLPMGVFEPDSASLSVTSRQVSLTGQDKWVRIQRARFMRPQASSRGTTVVNQIVTLIRGALGSDEPVNVTATSRATVGALTWEKDRDAAIIDLARQIGAWVFFDRDGVATIADLPTIGRSADWLIDAGAAGVLTELDRQSSRTDTRNVVVVTSSAADKAKFVPQYIWDNDPASPTYAGPIGVGATPPSANSAGPFGLAPFFYASPILKTVDEARKAGRSILSRVSGLASQVSLSQAPNPALDAFAVIDVLPPGRIPVGVEFIGTGGTIPRVLYRATAAIERHIADTVTHALDPRQAQRIEGRSTRSEDLPEESA